MCWYVQYIVSCIVFQYTGPVQQSQWSLFLCSVPFTVFLHNIPCTVCLYRSSCTVVRRASPVQIFNKAVPIQLFRTQFLAQPVLYSTSWTHCSVQHFLYIVVCRGFHVQLLLCKISRTFVVQSLVHCLLPQTQCCGFPQQCVQTCSSPLLDLPFSTPLEPAVDVARQNLLLKWLSCRVLRTTCSVSRKSV